MTNLAAEARAKAQAKWFGAEVGFTKLLKELDLPMPDGKYHEIKNEHYNGTRADLYKWWPLEGMGRHKDMILEDTAR